MAEIVQNAPSQDTGSIISNFWDFLLQYWWVFLLFAIIVGLIVLAYYIFKAKEENDRRRDSAVYATAMNIREACDINRSPRLIRKRYSLVNLLWLGIPFKWVEHSARLVDVDRNFLGWYRGHVKTQGGDIVFKAYKTKTFFFFEDDFLLYCPKSYVVNEKGAKTRYALPEKVVEFHTEHSNEIRIQCSTIQKQGRYYFFPNYVLVAPDGKKHLDLTEHISDSIAKVNFLVSLESAYGDMSKALGRAVEVNPLLRYGQKEPEKEKEIEQDADVPVK